MGAIAFFDWTNWQGLFPTIAGAGPSTVQLYWNIAASDGLVANDGTGPITDPATQQNVVDFTAAHLVSLFVSPYWPMTAAAGQQPSQIVGRIASAGTGSVNVSTQNDYRPGSAQWWQQTRFGSLVWEMTALYRTATYVPFGRSPGWPYFQPSGWPV